MDYKGYPKLIFDEETMEDEYYDKQYQEYIEQTAYEVAIKYHTEHFE